MIYLFIPFILGFALIGCSAFVLSREDEYEEFKINYHLDNNRLDTLEGDHEKLYRTLETIVVERDDLMARLRAISSVVGAVGVDRVENPPALLEN